MDKQRRDVSRQIRRASYLVVGSIILSRVIGFVREWAIAHYVGASASTDVYYASFTIPDMVNYLMAAGALGISFIPILADLKAKNNKATAIRLYQSISSWMGLVLLILIAIGEVFSRTLSDWIAPGFDSVQREELAFLIRIILPAQWFFYFGSLAMAVQHLEGKFLIPALAPIIYNLSIVGFGIGFSFATQGDEHQSVVGFSVGVAIGALCSHGILQYLGARQQGFSAKPYFQLDADLVPLLKRYLWMTLPIVLGFSLVATDEWIGKYFASSLSPKSLSYLAYARTEMRIPVAILGQAAGVASFPYLAGQWASGRYGEYARILFSELVKLAALGPLAAILMYVLSVPITVLLFGGGRFGPWDIAATALALQGYSVGILFWTIQIVLARGFYASQLTWVPSLLGGVCSLVAIPLYAWLAERMGFVGLSLAGSAAIALYAIVLLVLIVRHVRHWAPEFSFLPYLRFLPFWAVCLCLLTLIAMQVDAWCATLVDFGPMRLLALVRILIVGGCTSALGYLFLLGGGRVGLTPFSLARK